MHEHTHDPRSWLDVAFKEFMPHAHCFGWEPSIFIPTLLGDILTVLAYITIPALFIVVLVKRQDLAEHASGFLIRLSLFIIWCAATHAVAVLNLWQGYYFLAGATKLITGVVSAYVAGWLALRGVPWLLSVPHLSIFKERILAAEREMAYRRNREAEHHRLMMISPSAFAEVALDGRFTWVNREFARIAGWPAAELITKTFQEITVEETLDEDLKLLERLHKGEIDEYSMLKSYRQKDGETVNISLRVIAQRDESGEVTNYLSQIVEVP